MARQSNLYHKWSLEVRRNKFFRSGERVGVAVSGGPDSILLLAFMGELARAMGLRIAVVHFNHHLRGAESDGDERFVRQRAGELETEYFRAEADVAAEARKRRRNLEATARELRYRFFFSLIDQGKLDKIVTAHTANDQAETVLLRLLRGAGTRGLGGIYPVLDGKIVRPFLNLTRAAIEDELRQRKLEWRLDSSNLSLKHRRNRVRMELLPLLVKEFNPEIVSLLKQLADRARDDEECLEQQAREKAQPWLVREGREERIPVRAVLAFPPAIARRILRQMLLGARGNLTGIAYEHIESLRRFAVHTQSGGRLALPGGLEARKEFNWLVIAPQPSATAADFSYQVEVPGTIHVPKLGLTFAFKIVGPDEGQAYNELDGLGLDPGKLRLPLVLRNWRAGDQFRMPESPRRRKLKEIFTRRKIPLRQRRLWPVLVSGEEIVWVRNLPPAGGMAALPGTERLVISVEPANRPSEGPDRAK